MLKTPRLSLPCLMLLACLVACDASYSVEVEVNLSEEFLAQWDASYPAEVGVRYDAPLGQSGRLGPNSVRSPGQLCGATPGPVRLNDTLSTFGELPDDITVTVWIAPDPQLTQTRCAQLPDGGLASGSAPGGESWKVDTTPEQGVSRTAKMKRLSYNTGEAVLNF